MHITMPTRCGTISTVAMKTTFLLLTMIASTSARSSRRIRDLDVVCAAGTTKISTPFYFRHNSIDWCGVAVGQLANDYYNLAYRQECQRWLGTSSLPESVAQAKLSYCYEFSNGTVQYRMGVCCYGNPNGMRCFTGNQFTQWESFLYNGHYSYKFDYENNLSTCGANQVCQTKFTYYGSYGNVNNISVVKGCGEPVSCAADSQYGRGQCQYCAVSTPVCTSCCNTSFCNFDFVSPNLMRPSPCNPCSSYPCLNSGDCFNDGYNSTLGYYTTYYCRCWPFFGGRNCEANRTLCSTNMCLNGGTCYDYSELGAGQYRCNCTPPFVGERCELTSNLTCKLTESNSFAPSVYNFYYRSYNNIPYGNSYHSTYLYYDGSSYANCTKVAWNVRNKPEVVYYSLYDSQSRTDVICGDTTGRAAAYKVEFELTYCAVGSRNYYHWSNYRSCCQNITICLAGVNPCLNGGTCYDYSTITPGDNYRCECVQGFVGDNCELKSNLTCSRSDKASIIKPYSSAYMYANMNCTAAADYYRGKPSLVQYRYSDFVNSDCYDYSTFASSGGHRFKQGVDGQIGSDKFQFELTHCSRNDHTSILQFRGCCPVCLSSPCLNGGYCQQPNVSTYICRCEFGFNGKRCENRLSIATVSGDPHFVTIDRARIDYHGTRKFNLLSTVGSSQLNGLPYFNVYSRSINLYNITSVAYPLYVEVVINGSAVRLLANRSSSLLPTDKAVPVITLVNGSQVLVPYSSSIFNIYYDGSTVRCDTTFGLSVTFDGVWTITVNVPTTYNGKLTGIGGNSDGNLTNDFAMANGTAVNGLPNAFNLIGDSYIIPDPEQPDAWLPAPPQPPPCITFSTICGLINRTSGIFSNCISKLTQSLVNDLADMCNMDACFTNNASICLSIKAFVDYCAFNGAQIPCETWMSATGCGVAKFCPAGMTYQCSTSACQPTCSNPNANSTCNQPNKDACVCPPGQLLHNGSCTAICPKGCLDANQQLIQVGTTWRVNCSLFRCEPCENCTLSAKITETVDCKAMLDTTSTVQIPTTTTTPSPPSPTSTTTTTTTTTSTSTPKTTTTPTTLLLTLLLVVLFILQ